LSKIPEQIVINGGRQLRGTINAPPSKSHMHRTLIAASLVGRTSRIENASLCDDTRATMAATEAYGAEVRFQGDSVIVKGTDHIQLPVDIVDCGESASTMRFVTPILAHAEGISVVSGRGSLRQRPMQPLIDSLKQLGVQCHATRNNGHAPLIVFGGTYNGGKIKIRGDVSSQFISGLLFSASIADKLTSIEVTTALDSSPYVRMTLEVLKCHGITVDRNADLTEFSVQGEQSAKPHNHLIEGDYSSAAFLLAAGAVTGSGIGVSGLQTSDSLQGDQRILSLLREMNIGVEAGSGSVQIQPSHLAAIAMDAADCPDLVPPLAAMACYAHGKTKIMNAGRLRTKESNRLAALSSELKKMGAEIQETGDGLEIMGEVPLEGANVSSHNDHRIAMACSIAALGARGATMIDDVKCIAKSYPGFFDDLKRLGGDIYGRE
jgi:3-phosphoshikimate 1-carboxyvinyltransferase